MAELLAWDASSCRVRATNPPEVRGGQPARIDDCSAPCMHGCAASRCTAVLVYGTGMALPRGPLLPERRSGGLARASTPVRREQQTLRVTSRRAQRVLPATSPPRALARMLHVLPACVAPHRDKEEVLPAHDLDAAALSARPGSADSHPAPPRLASREGEGGAARRWPGPPKVLQHARKLHAYTAFPLCSSPSPPPLRLGRTGRARRCCPTTWTPRSSRSTRAWARS